MHMPGTDYSNDVPTLYEGDMALTKEQVEALGLTHPVSNKPVSDQEAQTRGSLRNPRQLWPNGIIPFVINGRIGIITFILDCFYTFFLLLSGELFHAF